MKAYKSEMGKKLLNDRVFCDNLRKMGTKENEVVVDSNGKNTKLSHVDHEIAANNRIHNDT